LLLLLVVSDGDDDYVSDMEVAITTDSASAVYYEMHSASLTTGIAKTVVLKDLSAELRQSNNVTEILISSRAYVIQNVKRFGSVYSVYLFRWL